MRTIFDSDKVDFAPYPSGALDGHLRAFAGLLGAGRYTAQHGLTKLRQFSDFSRWLKRNHIELRSLNERVVGRFLAARKKRYRDFGMASTLVLLMDHLRRLGVAPPKGADLPESGIDRIIREYRDHQIEDRCLGEPTVKGYVVVIRRFLNAVFLHGAFDPGELTSEKISGFVVAETTRLGRKACQLATCALRSFLRFLLMKGLLEKDLMAAVSGITSR
jgi:site-specific recombinase XerD